MGREKRKRETGEEGREISSQSPSSVFLSSHTFPLPVSFCAWYAGYSAFDILKTAPFETDYPCVSEDALSRASARSFPPTHSQSHLLFQ